MSSEDSARDENLVTVPEEDYVQALKIKRNNIITQIKRLDTIIRDNSFTSLTALKLQTEKAAAVYDNFDAIQSQLENIQQHHDEGDMREIFESMYFSTIGTAMEIIGQPEETTSTHQAELNKQLLLLTKNQAALPPLNLPTFNGEFTQWSLFKDAFEANINTQSFLTNSQRFQYLRGQLQGDALQIIQDLVTSEDSYQTAWKLLSDNYEDKNLLKHIHLKALFELPLLVKPDYAQCRKFIDAINVHIRSLEKLECKIDKWGEMYTIYLVESKLDSALKRDWDKIKEPRGHKLNLQELMDFLTRRCKLLMKDENQKDTKRPVIKQDLRGRQEFTKRYTFTTTTETISCEMCKGKHRLFSCPQFLQLEPTARKEHVLKMQLCLNCLSKGHIANSCKSSKCRKCNLSHNTLLHKKNPVTSEQVDSQQQKETPIVTASATITSQHSHTTVKYGLLATALIQIKDKNGQLQCCRALIDPGSQSSYITEKCISKLGLPTQSMKATVSGINKATFDIKNKVNLKFYSNNSNFSSQINCLVLPNVTGQLPHFRIDNLKFPKDLKLADPGFGRPSDIDVLLGVEIAWKLMLKNQIELEDGYPLLKESYLGWLVTGPLWLPEQIPIQMCHTTTLNNLDINQDEEIVSNNELNEQIKKFWLIEEITTKKLFSKEEIQCEKHFQETYKRAENGQFIVKFPMRENALNLLGNSEHIAQKRLVAMERRMKSDPKLNNQYKDFMKEYEQLGHMSECSPEIDISNFLPHHAVYKLSSETTKLRVVFDGSVKTDSNMSLNELLHVGPTIQSDLFSILVRFRLHNYVLSADIEKMYRMILMHPDDRKLQRIRWRSSTDQPVKIYELNTVTYGLASSPYLAIRCLMQLANDVEMSHPDISNVIRQDFYVDDLLTGSDNKDDLQIM